jgi:hypothetical protein
MRRKDEATRRVADLTLGAMPARAAERLYAFVEIDFDNLSGAIAEARTGEDGGFTVRIPRIGRFVVAIPVPTQGQWTPLGTVTYCWRASLEGQARKKVLLRGQTGVEGEAPHFVAHRPSR